MPLLILWLSVQGTFSEQLPHLREVLHMLVDATCCGEEVTCLGLLSCIWWCFTRLPSQSCPFAVSFPPPKILGALLEKLWKPLANCPNFLLEEVFQAVFVYSQQHVDKIDAAGEVSLVSFFFFFLWVLRAPWICCPCDSCCPWNRYCALWLSVETMAPSFRN